MHMFFGGRTSFGLDIGSSCIKAVQLKEKRGGYELEFFEVVQLPPELIVDGSIIDSIRLAEALKQLVKKARIRTKNVAIGLAGHASVIIKRISLPEMAEEELQESIKFEAEQYVPFDIEDVNVDFQILGPKEEPGQMDVMLVAVKKDVINEYVSVVKEAGLVPAVVDVDAFALSNMHEINYEIESGKNIALVNVGAHTINLNVVKNGVSVFTRDSAIGTSGVTETLQKEFHLPYESAEKLQRGEAVEGIGAAAAFEAMSRAYEDIVAEVARSLEYFHGSTMHEETSKVILSGGGALLKDFPNALAKKTGLVVSLAEPFRNISIPRRFDRAYTEEIAPIAAVAVGLALRRPDDR
ncbi:MAG: type IV pilus assembly protein PilM [Nitrospiraceae bacterium]|nr:type IV pilus assembly protein PilM [Nitrospiraceae bacterium]